MQRQPASAGPSLAHPLPCAHGRPARQGERGHAGRRPGGGQGAERRCVPFVAA